MSDKQLYLGRSILIWVVFQRGRRIVMILYLELKILFYLSKCNTLKLKKDFRKRIKFRRETPKVLNAMLKLNLLLKYKITFSVEFCLAFM